jgi:hypothetical protein
MCCFSQPVEQVSDTNIFARGTDGRQFLVYSMNYAAAADLAMVLPLPVPPSPSEDAVRFINLKRYPDFFEDLNRGFPPPTGLSLAVVPSRSLPEVAPPLRVHDVGDFEASFVPRLADFGRLDERFRIPPQVWDRLPAYRDYGFGVFKLKGSAAPRSAGFVRRWFGGRAATGPVQPRHVHAMAFEFPRRNSNLLYFPTVHVHDGTVHRHASFDHMLYCQAGPETRAYLQGWAESDGPAAVFMNIAHAEGIVDPNQHCWRRPLQGQRENKDALVGEGGSLPEYAVV